MLVAGFLAVVLISFYAANHISQDEAWQEFVKGLGFFGIVATGFVAGVNLIIPLHTGVFGPLFLSAGNSYWVVVLGFTIGTTVADSLGYVFGKLGRSYSKDQNKKFLYSKKLKDYTTTLPTRINSRCK